MEYEKKGRVGRVSSFPYDVWKGEECKEFEKKNRVGCVKSLP